MNSDLLQERRAFFASAPPRSPEFFLLLAAKLNPFGTLQAAQRFYRKIKINWLGKRDLTDPLRRLLLERHFPLAVLPDQRGEFLIMMPSQV